jgi:hypothetical protein
MLCRNTPKLHPSLISDWGKIFHFRTMDVSGFAWHPTTYLVNTIWASMPVQTFYAANPSQRVQRTATCNYKTLIYEHQTHFTLSSNIMSYPGIEGSFKWLDRSIVQRIAIGISALAGNRRCISQTCYVNLHLIVRTNASREGCVSRFQMVRGRISTRERWCHSQQTAISMLDEDETVNTAFWLSVFSMTEKIVEEGEICALRAISIFRISRLAPCNIRNNYLVLKCIREKPENWYLISKSVRWEREPSAEDVRFLRRYKCMAQNISETQDWTGAFVCQLFTIVTSLTCNCEMRSTAKILNGHNTGAIGTEESERKRRRMWEIMRSISGAKPLSSSRWMTENSRSWFSQSLFLANPTNVNFNPFPNNRDLYSLKQKILSNETANLHGIRCDDEFFRCRIHRLISHRWLRCTDVFYELFINSRMS